MADRHTIIWRCREQGEMRVTELPSKVYWLLPMGVWATGQSLGTAPVCVGARLRQKGAQGESASWRSTITYSSSSVSRGRRPSAASALPCRAYRVGFRDKGGLGIKREAPQRRQRPPLQGLPHVNLSHEALFDHALRGDAHAGVRMVPSTPVCEAPSYMLSQQ